ncbi:hypothetical protein, partial [Mitsuaria sp. TWR114]|uniref:hypothetical protein n=1 Tax=Mitsuaria sp. TWR114 TaxID=2601731 RepID=UPI00164B0665
MLATGKNFDRITLGSLILALGLLAGVELLGFQLAGLLLRLGLLGRQLLRLQLRHRRAGRLRGLLLQLLVALVQQAREVGRAAILAAGGGRTASRRGRPATRGCSGSAS